MIDFFEASFMVAPSFRLEYHGSLCGVCHYKAINDVVYLAAETASFVYFAYKLFGSRAIGRVLKKVKPLLH